MNIKDFCKVTINTERLTYTVLESAKVLDRIISSLDNKDPLLYKSMIHINLLHESYHTNKLYIKLNKVVSVEVHDLNERDIEFLYKYFNPTTE